MSKYTTGELAKLCNVTVRTVQYYDSRNILSPSELSEGGRRLYLDEDLKKLRIICFLRDVGISIKGIGELLNDEHPEKVISVLINEQQKLLFEELEEKKEKLNKVEVIKRELKSMDNFSVESIGDIAYMMENKKRLKKIHRVLFWGAGLPIEIIEISLIILWIVKGIWFPFVAFLPFEFVFGLIISKYYFEKVAYICPECHNIFKAKHIEGFLAPHTPRLRKLTCNCCGYKGYCVETVALSLSEQAK
ncbi:MAG: MerR family transcriptional regulator [Lachnospiraceae bacterium]|nr:MerR family transcriptional regulator [Lachnospiraceae bacterium]